jgi:hypothetical protein
MVQLKFFPFTMIMAVAAVLSVSPAMSEGIPYSVQRFAPDSIFNTKRLLPRTGNECAGVPDCSSVESSRTEVGTDENETIIVTCPESHPYAWHWDTQQHEHLYVKLLGRAQSSLTFKVSNRSDTASG